MSADRDYMTTRISKTTIESAAYDNIISFLDDRTIVTDPRDPSGYSKRRFIYDVDPLAKGLNFGDFPYIIAEFPSIEYSSVSSDGKIKTISWSMSITIRTARDGASQATSGTGKTDMFTIGDSLQSLFNSNTHKQSLQDLDMFFMKLTKEDSSSPVIDNKYLHQSDYTLTFQTRMAVSD